MMIHLSSETILHEYRTNFVSVHYDSHCVTILRRIRIQLTMTQSILSVKQLTSVVVFCIDSSNVAARHLFVC